MQNLKSLFTLKHNDLHPACKIYKNICSCESSYVSETKQKIDGTQKNLEVFYIALMRPILNEQCNLNLLTLFRNGIT